MKTAFVYAQVGKKLIGGKPTLDLKKAKHYLKANPQNTVAVHVF